MIKFLMDHSKELTIAGALSVLTICYFQQRELTKLRTETKAKQVVVDSLSGELFDKSIELGRYEVMWEIFREEDSITAEKIAREVE